MGPRDEWSKRSEFHRRGADLFYKYAIAIEAVSKLTFNADISVAEMHQFVSLAEQAPKGEPVDHLIETAMKIPDIKRRKRREPTVMDESPDKEEPVPPFIDPTLSVKRTRSGRQRVSRS
jgi:hypothetical protein